MIDPAKDATMWLDEALAVYIYIKDRPPGSRSPTEEKAFSRAWEAICYHAEKAIRTVPPASELSAVLGNLFPRQ